MTQRAFQEFLGLKALIKSISSRDVLVKSSSVNGPFFNYAYILAPGVGLGQNSDKSSRIFFFLSFLFTSVVFLSFLPFFIFFFCN